VLGTSSPRGRQLESLVGLPPGYTEHTCILQALESVIPPLLQQERTNPLVSSEGGSNGSGINIEIKKCDGLHMGQLTALDLHSGRY
jgi:hypothetical protein